MNKWNWDRRHGHFSSQQHSFLAVFISAIYEAESRDNSLEGST
jgi:hypothetical protein